MSLRISLALALLALSCSAAAQYTYIVPISGVAVGYSTGYFGEEWVTNPNSTAATLRYEAIYTPVGVAPCVLPPDRVLPPRSVTSLARPCSSLYALVVRSDQPLRFMVDILAVFTGRPSGLNNQYQQIETATEWLPPDTDALIPTIRLSESDGKGNLVLVNPNDFVLTVNVHVDRPEVGKSADSTIQVQPRSLLMSSLAKIPPPSIGFPDQLPYSGVHHVTVRANGKFQAGVSNMFGSSTTYRSATPLQP
jgi:hypothetical protein